MYSQEITRRHRAAIIIALDRSGSMQERIRLGRMMLSKAEAVTMMAGSLITEIIDRCRRIDSLRNYYDVAVVGYSNDEVEMLLHKDGFISVEELAAMAPEPTTMAVEESMPDGSSAMVEHTLTQWFQPKAEGKTPMYEAMLHIRDMVEKWCATEQNRESFPPVVINITDGESSDCDDRELTDVCSQIRRVSTSDGNVLMLNIHISANHTLPAMVFPMAEELSHADRYARTLAECSSEMPEVFNEAIMQLKGAGATPPFVGMGYNASIIELLSIINIGSRSVNNMQ
ncbi:MAG: VWA domain-containing protein [Alistipes sp.]|nr:VWA domain-containing protein [Alistipes sp.]